MNIYRYIAGISLVSIGIVFLASCATTADEVPDPTVSVEHAGEQQISPAASPGSQDVYHARLAVASDPGIDIERLSVFVENADGTEIYRLSREIGRAASEIPARVTWGGTSDGVAFVDDGRYTLHVELEDELGQTARSNGLQVVVDNTPPQVNLRTPYVVFSPDGDGNRDSLTLDHRVQEPAVQRGAIRNADGEAVHSWGWDSSQPGEVTWDGRNSAGDVVPDGRFRYVFTAVDAAGNTSTETIENIRVSTEDFAVSIERAVPAFSPNGDGLRDVAAYRVSAQDADRVSSWTLTMNDSDGMTAAQRTGSSAPDERITFDGRSEGERLESGAYVAEFRVTYRNGDVVTDSARPVQLDLQGPEIAVSAEAERFSPRSGDGSLAMQHDASGATFWEGAVISTESDQPILTTSWEDELPSEFLWNGQTSSGNTASSGEYVYRLTGRDTAGNETSASTSAFILDREGPDVSANIAPTPFTPDGDGTNDQLSITITSDDRSGIANWTLSILGPTGNEFFTRSGQGTPPESLSWDGTGNDGSTVQSARDYTAAVTVTDEAGNRSTTERNVPVGILVGEDSEGDVRIRLSSIVFAPFEDDYRDLRDPERERRNQRTLDRIADILAEYPNRSVQVEGHAVHLYTDEERRDVEQEETLLPLSRDRAEAIRDALAERGIATDRLTVVGRGGNEPLVPHTNLEDRWRNRRVEFELSEG